MIDLLSMRKSKAQYCGNCHAKVADDQRTCPNCGVTLESSNPYSVGANRRSSVWNSQLVSSAFNRSFQFRGRASRKELWTWIFYCGVFLVGFLVVLLLRAGLSRRTLSPGLFIVLWFVVFQPTLAMTTRRLHDLGRSGRRGIVTVLCNIVYLCALLTLAPSLTTTPVDSPSTIIFKAIGIFVVAALGALLAYADVKLALLLATPGESAKNQYGSAPNDDDWTRAPETFAARFCTKCGNELTAEETFCTRCGAQVAAPPSVSRTPSFVDVLRAVGVCWRKCCDFSGRAGRLEFWSWQTFYFLILIVNHFVAPRLASHLLDVSFPIGIRDWRFFALVLAVPVALLIPTFAVATRRLHDIGRTGAWIIAYVVVSLILAALAIPMMFLAMFLDNPSPLEFTVAMAILFGFLTVCGLVFYGSLVALSLPGMRGANRYGPDPTVGALDDSVDAPHEA